MHEMVLTESGKPLYFDRTRRNVFMYSSNCHFFRPLSDISLRARI